MAEENVYKAAIYLPWNSTVRSDVHLGYGTVWFRPVSTLVDITSNTLNKCTATFRTQISIKCLRIKFNGFRPVQMLVDITSNTFCNCTATFRMHCSKQILQHCALVSYEFSAATLQDIGQSEAEMWDILPYNDVVIVNITGPFK
jgi:hypothetical protein